MKGYSNSWTLCVLLITLAVLTVFASQSTAQLTKSRKSCASLYEANNYGGQNFSVEDGKYFSNLGEEHTSSSTVWNLTSSFKVSPGCLFTACNESYFDGHCQEFREETPALPPAFISIASVNCTCAADCRCSSIYMRKASCARAYLHTSCNSCNAYYTDLKGKKPNFPEEFQKYTASVLVRPGCTLTVYDEEDYEGDSSTSEGIVESWKPDQLISSYECTCSDLPDVPIINKTRNPDYPAWINVPSTVDEVSKMVNGPAGRHPALLAALQSLKHKRSSRNAYILLIGTTGSGKSTAINLLFDNPNLTKTGNFVSTTTDIHEFRVPVPVDELGIANSELRVIDTPGLGDTRGLEQDAKFLATLDEYLSNHEELRNRIPNVVLVFHKFDDNRFGGEGSTFVKMLRGLDSFHPRITDKEYSNVIFVLSHFTAVTKDVSRRPKVKLASFKNIIEEYSLFPKPVSIAVAENKAADQELPLVNGYFRLPNGDYYPRNIFEKIQLHTSSGGDPIGGSIITAAFRDSDEFNITSSTMLIVGSGNAKISKYLSILTGAIFNVENTEISQLLGNASESLNPELKKNFPDALFYLQKALNMRNILTVSDIPRTTLDIIKLLTGLKQNEANLYLLEKALDIKPPILKENTIAGYSYNVFKDMPLPISPLKLGIMKNSDIGYTFPAVMTCLVERIGAEIFKVFENKDEYINYRLKSLNIGGRIPASSFTGEIRAGSNVKGVTMGTEGSSVTAVREFRNFELVLNDRLDLTTHFVDTLKSLQPFNATDYDSVEMWRSFFNEYGTHVVQSAHGGGAIEIQLTSDKPFGMDIAEALYDLVQFAEDVATGSTRNKTLERDGVQHTLKFRGGDHAYHTSDLTKMSLGDAARLLEDWKESLSLSPTILTSETRLLPLSELAKKVGQNISSEIQRATDLLFNSKIKYEKMIKPNTPLPGLGREETTFSQNENSATSMFPEMFAKMIEETRKSDERFQAMMLKMEEDRKASEERREKARQDQVNWEREQQTQRERDRRDDIKNSKETELQRQKMQHKLNLARESTELNRQIREEEYRIRAQKAAADAAAQQAELMIKLAERPTDGGGGCLLKGTLILMADGTQKLVEDVEIGDMVLDHELNPTMVVAALEKFLLNDTFYGFTYEGPYFFTNTHVLVGPSEEVYGIQLLAHSLDGLLAENPLFEFLEPIQMNENGTKYLTFDQVRKKVAVKEMAVYADPAKTSEDTLVHIIQVESIHGTYFANGVVCRHELPPIEQWPNTMYLILSFGMYPEVQKFETVSYTLATVYKTKNMLAEVGTKVMELLDMFKTNEVPQEERGLKYEMISFDPYEVLGRAFTNPSFGTFGAGLYQAIGKMMSLVIDNPSVPLQQHQLGYLYREVTRIVLEHVKTVV